MYSQTAVISALWLHRDGRVMIFKGPIFIAVCKLIPGKFTFISLPVIFSDGSESQSHLDFCSSDFVWIKYKLRKKILENSSQLKFAVLMCIIAQFLIFRAIYSSAVSKNKSHSYYFSVTLETSNRSRVIQCVCVCVCVVFVYYTGNGFSSLFVLLLKEQIPLSIKSKQLIGWKKTERLISLALHNHIVYSITNINITSSFFKIHCRLPHRCYEHIMNNIVPRDGYIMTVTFSQYKNKYACDVILTNLLYFVVHWYHFTSGL